MKGNHGWNMDNGNNPETRPSIPLLWPLPSRKSQPLVGVASAIHAELGLGAVGHPVGSGATTPAGKGGYVPAGWPSFSRSDLCGARTPFSSSAYHLLEVTLCGWL